MKTFLALDLEGSNLRIGEIDPQGKVLQQKLYGAEFEDQAGAVKIIEDSLGDYIRNVGWATGKYPVAMGVGLVGRVDPRQGVWMQIDSQRSDPTPLADMLSRNYGIPAWIDNDVKAATQAVQRFELKSNNFIYMNVGACIAASVVADGVLIRGGHYNSGEVGHAVVDIDVGVTCSCGRKNCIELIAGGIGFDKTARLLAPKYKTSLTIPPEGQRVSMEEVFELYRKGDGLCTRMVQNAADALAGIIMNMVKVTDPDTVVLGGEMMTNGDIHGEILVRLNPTTVRFVTGGVVLTGLNPEVIGLIGAGAMAMNNYEGKRI